jgi:glycosyltransferase involved in cell wall biosynthesis
MAKVSVLIPCFNERDMIRECVESVRWADEVFVVDALSTDGTFDILKALGVRCVQHPWEGYAGQKNWAIPQCSHEWVLWVDSDERATPELAAEVRAIVAANGTCDAHYIPRRSYFLGRRIRFSGWGGDKVVRLFRRDNARFKPGRVHESLKVEGRVGECRQALIHHTCRDLSDYLAKIQRYAGLAAADRREKGVKPSRLRMVTTPIGRFLRSYILKAGFLDGWRGLVISGTFAVEGFWREAFLWQLCDPEAQPPAKPDST